MQRLRTGIAWKRVNAEYNLNAGLHGQRITAQMTWKQNYDESDKRRNLTVPSYVQYRCAIQNIII